MVQRVAWAKVSVNGRVVGQCGPGLLVLAAAHRDDTEANARKMADRLLGMRIFEDDAGKMNLSLRQLQEAGREPSILAISNFTLYGDATQRRPSFVLSAPFERGEALFQSLIDALREEPIPVETGIFGAEMKVELLNDGPVTLVVDA